MLRLSRLAPSAGEESYEGEEAERGGAGLWHDLERAYEFVARARGDKLTICNSITFDTNSTCIKSISEY